MNTKLKQYFPVIRTREEVLREIEKDMKLTEQFYSWKEEQRQEFLDFCTGVKGIKLLYDGFFNKCCKNSLTSVGDGMNCTSEHICVKSPLKVENACSGSKIVV